MDSLKAYYNLQKLSPRDPNYIPELEICAKQMAETIEALNALLQKKIDELENT
jgi:hypothetical protein